MHTASRQRRKGWFNRALPWVALPLCAFTPLVAGNYTDGNSSITLTPANDAVFGGKVPDLMNKIAEKYQTSALLDVTRGTSTAQALATTGSGAAYASGKHKFIIGGGAGLSVNAINQSLSEVWGKLNDLGGEGLPRFGVGAQLSAVVGVNIGNLSPQRYIGPLESSRLTILANFFNISSDNITSGLNLSATVAGLHAQYQLGRPRGSSAFSYGELLLVTGFDYSRLSARYDSTSGSKALTPVTTGTGTALDPQLVWNPGGVMSLTSGSGTIPVELVTNVRLLYLLSFYLGAAADFNVGRATTDMNLSGTITGNNGSGSSTVGGGSLSVSKSASPQLASLRGFFGLQLNLVPARQGNVVAVFAQASATSLNGFAVQSGVRCAW